MSDRFVKNIHLIFLFALMTLLIENFGSSGLGCYEFLNYLRTYFLTGLALLTISCMMMNNEQTCLFTPQDF